MEVWLERDANVAFQSAYHQPNSGRMDPLPVGTLNRSVASVAKARLCLCFPVMYLVDVGGACNQTAMCVNERRGRLFFFFSFPMIFPSARAPGISLGPAFSLSPVSICAGLLASISYISTEMNGSIKAMGITDEAAGQAWNMKNKLLVNRRPGQSTILIIMRITEEKGRQRKRERGIRWMETLGTVCTKAKNLAIEKESIYLSWPGNKVGLLYWVLVAIAKKTTNGERMCCIHCVTIGQLHISVRLPQVPVR